MFVLRVGELYNPSRIEWPAGNQLRITHDGVELLILLEHPTDDEVHAVRRHPMEFAWVDLPHHGVLAYRFVPGIPWSDAAYTPHRTEPGSTPGLPPGVLGHRLVHVVLVDSTTGVIRALRATTWPPHFAGVVRDCVARMLNAPFDPIAAGRELDEFFDHYTSDRLPILTDVRCIGGQPA